MPIKYHLFIISIIILLLALWMGLRQEPGPVLPMQQAPSSPHAIDIIRASWGLNCNSLPGNKAAQYAQEARIEENNVFSKVSEICNGKSGCNLSVNPEFLGINPAPSCLSKELVVEYRCFSYDRPWLAKAAGGTLSIKCDQLAH